MPIFLVVFHLIWNREWLVKIAASGRLARLAAEIFAGLLIGSAFLVLPVEQGDRGSGASIERRPTEWEAPHQLSAEES
jgi:hypothetical protein